MGVPGNADLLLLKTAAAAGGYQVSRSLRFNGSIDSTYLSRTPGSAGNQKTWTWSGWVKRATLTGSYQQLFGGGPGSGANDGLYFNSGSDSLIYFFDGSTTTFDTSAQYRDPSAWYHIVLAIDTTQATASNRVKLYVNGTQVTTFASTSYPSQNANSQYINSTTQQRIGAHTNAGYYFNGYLADIWFLDGIAATPSDFAETDATTGQWIPKAYSGSKGSNGFHLEFADNSAATAAALGKDTSGNGLNWTPNNFSVTAGAGNDSLVDTPTSYGTDTGVGGEVRGNYATLNPLAKGTTQTLSNGNLDVTGSESGHGTTNATIAVTAGSKVYMEFTRTGGGVGGGWGFASNPVPYSGFPTSGTGIWWVYDNGTNWSYHANGTVTEYSSKTTNGQTLQLAIDYDAGKAWIGINNTWFTSSNATTGNPSTGANPTFTFTTSLPLFPLVESFGWTVSCNFGQRAFAYTAPSGFKALCDTNLTAPVIAKPSTVMDVKLYTGTGSSQTISGLGFSPDFVWIKERSADRNHRLQDSVRGANVSLRSNSTAAEATNAIDGYLSAFTSDGFTTAAGSSSILDVGESSGTYVAWAWDAGTTTSSNGSGSITSSVRANASAGFSIVTYTGNGTAGATWGHGLGVTPGMIVIKARDSVTDGSWFVGHSGMGLGYARLLLNSTAANNGTPGNVVAYDLWNNTAATSTVVTVGSYNGVNQSGKNYVAYVFAPVAGYSSFGSYTGNGSTDGPFVYTGFRPRWILFKNANSSATSWDIYDTARNTYNLSILRLFPDQSIAESNDYDFLDINSNGFKIRNNNLGNNGSGNTIVYAAFAESPFQYARAR